MHAESDVMKNRLSQNHGRNLSSARGMEALISGGEDAGSRGARAIEGGSCYPPQEVIKKGLTEKGSHFCCLQAGRR